MSGLLAVILLLFGLIPATVVLLLCLSMAVPVYAAEAEDEIIVSEADQPVLQSYPGSFCCMRSVPNTAYPSMAITVIQ